MEHIRIFQKCLPYRSYQNQLVLDSTTSYEIPEFQNLRTEYLSTQDALFRDINFEDWQKVTRKYNPSSEIVNRINKKTFEMFNRPWLKMYEILEKFNLIPSTNLNTLHLEEEVGGMVCAMNHYLRSQEENINWNWIATHNNPYYEDDEFEEFSSYYPINDSLIHFTLEKWSFGEDYSGNICNPRNISFLESKCAEMGDVSFITADGSVNTQLEPNEKENKLYVYQYSELVAALKILADRGNFVWKVFTLFNQNNICLLYFLNLVFMKVSLFKTLSCPPHSFEIYVVCETYRKSTPNLESVLEQMMNNIGNENPIFKEDFIPKEFLKEHLEKMKLLKDAQLDCIRDYLYFKQNAFCQAAPKFKSRAKSAGSNFLNAYNILPLSTEYRLTPVNNNLNSMAKISPYDLDYLSLSVDQINSFGDMNNRQRRQMLNAKLSQLSRKILLSNGREIPKLSNFIIDVIHGRPIEKVTKTMFITPVFLHKMSAVVEHHYQQPMLTLSNLDVNCNFHETLAVNFEFFENYGTSERTFWRAILRMWLEKQPNEISFENFYFLTHFSVSVLAVLMFFYEDCMMDGSGKVILKKFIRNNFIREMERLQQIIDSENFDSIVSFMSPIHIQRSDFAVKLIEINNYLLIKHMLNFTNSL